MTCAGRRRPIREPSGARLVAVPARRRPPRWRLDPGDAPEPWERARLGRAGADAHGLAVVVDLERLAGDQLVLDFVVAHLDAQSPAAVEEAEGKPAELRRQAG